MMIGHHTLQACPSATRPELPALPHVPQMLPLSPPHPPCLPHFKADLTMQAISSPHSPIPSPIPCPIRAPMPYLCPHALPPCPAHAPWNAMYMPLTLGHDKAIVKCTPNLFIQHSPRRRRGEKLPAPLPVVAPVADPVVGDPLTDAVVRAAGVRSSCGLFLSFVQLNHAGEGPYSCAHEPTVRCLLMCACMLKGFSEAVYGWFVPVCGSIM